jgi:hypothetical protein
MPYVACTAAVAAVMKSESGTAILAHQGLDTGKADPRPPSSQLNLI